MMLYFFVKKEGNAELHGVEVEQDKLPEAFVAKQTELSQAGYELSDSAEYTSQIIRGGQAGMVPQADLDAANAKIAELEKTSEVKAAE